MESKLCNVLYPYQKQYTHCLTLFKFRTSNLQQNQYGPSEIKTKPCNIVDTTNSFLEHTTSLLGTSSPNNHVDKA